MMEQVLPPTGAQVLAHLGWAPEAGLLAQAQAHVEAVALQARSYTRSRGWTIDPTAFDEVSVAEDIAAVIVSATCRSLSNPEQAKRVEAGSFSSVPGSVASWSLLEKLILDGYRLRAG